MRRHDPAPKLDGQYLLGCVLEEAGEAVQIGGKAMRHGWDSYSPDDPDMVPNRILLAQEVGDLLGAARFAAEQGVMDTEVIYQFAEARYAKLSIIAPEDEIAE